MKQRKFKFRAWSKQRKAFVVNCYPCGSGESYGFDLCGIVDDGDNELEDDGLVLMQFTGLKDKNGNDIYEGDILDLSEKLPFTGNAPKQKMPNEKGKVIFHEGSFWIKSSSRKRRLNSLSIRWCGLQIIGNIHENSGLMTVAP